MKLEEFTSEYIMGDVAKLQYLFKLKSVTRYDRPRKVGDDTESVAEHLYGMQILAHYFLPLEDPTHTLNHARIAALITVHDFDEIETGDYLSYRKTSEHQQEAQAALPKVLAMIPTHIQNDLTNLIKEYETQSTQEARFVKAIDKVEPLLQVYNETGRAICHHNKCTAEDSLRIKTAYIEPFPYIKKFALTLHQALIDGGYYWEEGR